MFEGGKILVRPGRFFNGKKIAVSMQKEKNDQNGGHEQKMPVSKEGDTKSWTLSDALDFTLYETVISLHLVIRICIAGCQQREAILLIQNQGKIKWKGLRISSQKKKK